MPDSKKVLIIGLDGVSWNVLNPMIENGYMPFLQDFIKKGKSGILKSTEPPITPTAWTSFQTGLSPEVHKIMGFRNFYMKEGKLQTRILSASSVSAKRIWDILSENNRRLCLLNIPLTYPPFPVNGILVSGFPVPSVNCNFTYPEDFKNELFRYIPDFQVMQIDIDAIQKSVKKIEDVVTFWSKSVSQKIDLVLTLLKKESWDVFMVHFQETDLLQHYLWHCISKNHPEHNPDDFPKVAQFYLRLDNKLSKVITEALKKDFSILILSDHGFQTCYCRFKASNWLFQKGYLVLNKNIKTNLSLIIKKLFDLPSMYKFKSKIKQKKPIEDITNRFLKSGINYGKSICFIETNGTNISFAHFLKSDNVLIKQVLDKLNLLSHNGYKIVKEIININKSGNTYKIIFADGIVASSSIMPDKKPFFEIPKPFEIQHLGVHHRDGIIIFDESIKHHKLSENIFDVPEIIMRLQDVPFTPSGESKEIEGLTAKESTEIENQLKGLGYL
jgi:predicted AlkP superfamily phosphohydrolase/phosphomutase